MAKDIQMWSPLRELDRVRHDFDDLLDRFFGSRTGTEGHFESLALPLESFIDKGNLVVRADLPGIDPKQVEITVTGDQLMIRGKRERSHEEKGRNFIQREVSYGE
ncbi:MAG: Hsp20/alpha crystallin family protein, partial [Candidatus Binataceae bacterium]